MNQFASQMGMPQQPMTVAQMQRASGPSTDMTATSISAFSGEVASKGGLMVQFFYHRQPIGGRTARTPGAPKFETRLAVAKKPYGDMFTLAVHNITEEDAQRMFPAEWQAFKTFQDTPTNGTPLHELPGATQSMIAILVLGGIRSIEDLGNLPTDVCANMGLDALEAQKLATIWLQRKRGAGNDIDLAGRLAQLEADRERDREELQRLRNQTAAQESTIETLRSMGIGVGQGQQAAPPAEGAVPHFPVTPIPLRDPEADGSNRPQSDIFTMTELIQGDAVRNLPDPLGE